MLGAIIHNYVSMHKYLTTISYSYNTHIYVCGVDKLSPVDYIHYAKTIKRYIIAIAIYVAVIRYT